MVLLIKIIQVGNTFYNFKYRDNKEARLPQRTEPVKD